MTWRILVVDDDKAIRDLVRATLEDHEVIEAADGARGLALACTQSPDLILLDRQMPHLDGLEALRTLQENEATASIPVLILSALKGIDDRVAGLSAGALDYIVKPFSPPELKARVASSLRQLERWRFSKAASAGDTTHAAALGGGSAGEGAPSKHLAPGALVDGKYRIVSLIQEGGMGVVYHAEQELLQRQVALKLIRSNNMSRPSFQIRFFREARLGSRLSHPCFPLVHDFGRTREGDLYLAMDLVRGQTLRQLLEEGGALAVGRSVELIAELLDGVSAAHAIRIVHRDLKTSNVMVDTQGQIKILDLGLAKDLGSETDPQITRIGASIGTPMYLSPEQAQGKAVDERSDIYSIGVMLYELLCGQPPFVDGYASEVMRRHCAEQPRPPSESGVPQQLSAIVMKALEKSPSSRWQTAQAFREALLEVRSES